MELNKTETITTNTKKMKYAEVTIIKNVETRTLYNSIQWFFGVEEGERMVDEKDRILMEFEGEPPFDIKEKYVDLKYKISIGISQSRILFIITDKEEPAITHYFSLNSTTDATGTQTLNLGEICKENPKYTRNKISPSYYNYVFYCYFCGVHHNVLYIARLTSAEKMPRFVIAYDDQYISKTQVIYIVRNIFMKTP